MNTTQLLGFGATLCIVVLAFSSRVSWLYYKSADNVNRILLRFFVGGLFAILTVAALTGSGVLPLYKPAVFSAMAAMGWIACGVLFVLVARELWGILRRIQLIRAVNTMAEPEDK
jgi:hypothetical protein